MARLKRDTKQKAVASVNLHKFFSARPAAQASAAKASPEIIIIDSSDDDDPEPSKFKRLATESYQGPSNKRLKSSTSLPSVAEGTSRSGSSRSFLDTAQSIEDDEWGMQNDELGTHETIDLTEILEAEITVIEDVDTCPVCGKSFLKAFISQLQDHINGCLDKPIPHTSSSRRHVSRSVTPKPLRALSSLLSPHSVRSNAFSVLMASTKENQAWQEAEVAEKSTFKTNKGRRKAPFYKVLQGMPIAVDAFRYGNIPEVKAYFLTHAHSDHYTNLSSTWKNGPIYCSQVTANLIIHKLSVDPKWVHPLPMDVATTIPDTGGVQVTPIEANHCPGSCIFLFEGKQTVNAGDSTFLSSSVGSSRIFRYLHCGDFRASPAHVLHPAIKGKKVDHVYLDTTYHDPKYCFPPQPLVITACADLAKRIVLGTEVGTSDNEGKQQAMDDIFVKIDKTEDLSKTSKKVLVVIGTYSVGKERIVSAVAKALNCKIYCDERKVAIIRCESDPDLESMLTEDPLSAGVHIVPLGLISPEKLKNYVGHWKDAFSKVVGFRPTGWTHTPPAGMNPNPPIPSVIARHQAQSFTWSHLHLMKNSSQNLQVYAVPYSEHSSFFELTCFALSLDWGKMIATVNVGSEKSRASMSKWFDRWEAERKKSKLDIVPHRSHDYW